MAKQKNENEKEILAAFEKGELKRSKRAKEEMEIATQAASAYLRKDARINIRLSTPDLKLLKRRAAEEGMPYQTLVASVLHKFVTGQYHMAQ